MRNLFWCYPFPFTRQMINIRCYLQMFVGCRSLNVNLPWDTSKVVDMSGMVRGYAWHSWSFSKEAPILTIISLFAYCTVCFGYQLQWRSQHLWYSSSHKYESNVSQRQIFSRSCLLVPLDHWFEPPCFFAQVPPSGCLQSASPLGYLASSGDGQHVFFCS